MAISKLVTGGQSFERPSVGAFFGNKPMSSNDNVERISSDFLTKDIMKSIVNALDTVAKELIRLQDTSKNIVKSFDVLIRNTRDLNRDVTRRFRDVNNELNRSRMDFLRSLMTTPIPASDKPTTIGALVDKAEKTQQATTEQATQQEQAQGKSWLEMIGNLLDYLPDFGGGNKPSGKGWFDRLKGAGRGAVRAGRSVPGMIFGALAGAAVGNMLEGSIEESKGEFKNKVYTDKISGIIKDHPNKEKLIDAFNSMSPKQQEIFFMQHFHAFAFRQTNEEGVRKLEEMAGVPVSKSAYARGLHDTDAQGYLPDSEISSNRSMTTESDSTGKIRQTTTSGIINERSENDSTMKMNTFAEKGTETGVMMGTSMTSDEKGVRELKEFFGQRISGGFMRRDRYTMKYKGHDLDLNKTEYFQIRGHVESGDYDSAFKILDKLARREAMRKHVAAGGKTSTFGQPEKVEGGPETPPEAQPGESELLNKRIAGLASKNGLNPATVTAQLEGGIPTSITSDGVTIDTYNDLTDAEKEKVNTARRMRSEMQSGGKQTVDQNQTSQAPAAAPSGALGGNEGAGQTQQQAPPAPAGGNEGAGTPEKAPPAAGAAPAGGTDTGATGTPTTAPAPAAAPSGGTSGETAGAGTPAAETTPSTPATSAAPAEGMGGSPSGTGTPEATPPAPSTPPAPAATPETSSAGGDPIVVNTSSTKNNKGSVGGEKNNIAGQNLPMTAQNEKIQEYLARQTVNYQ